MEDDGNNQPLSEQYHRIAKRWCDAEAAASLLEDSKSAVLAQRVTALGDIAVNRAETMVKSSPEWQDYINKMIAARKNANLLKVQMEFLRMKFSEWQSDEANKRAESRL